MGCLKKETVQTPVTKIYEEKQTISQKHLSEKKITKFASQRKEAMFASPTPLHRKLPRRRFNTSASPRIPKELNSREWLSKVISSKDANNTQQALRELSLSQRNAKKLDLEY